jgi:polyisoprenoid-binding protein YceI
MSTPLFRLTIVLIIILAANAGYAEPVRYTADKWHTRIFFTADHMGLSNFSGRFTEHEVDFLFDEEDMTNSSVEVTVPVASIDTFSPELNSKMGDPGFFDSASHPNLHFVSTKIEAIDATHATMKGDLTIKGITLPVTFDVTVNGKVMHPRFNLNNAGFTATAVVDSHAYKVNPLPDWMLAPSVMIRIEMEAFEGDRVPYYGN